MIEAMTMTADLASPSLAVELEPFHGQKTSEGDLDAFELFEFREAWESTWVVIPPTMDPEVPAMARRLRDISAWTRWSDRRLAELLGTTHPTISAARRGRATTRLRELPDQIATLHRIVERLSILCERDPAEVMRLLETRRDGNQSAEDHLADGDFSRAYLAALDVRTPPTREGLMGSRIRDHRPGTVAIEDFDE